MRQPSRRRPDREPEVEKGFLEKSFPTIYGLMRSLRGSGGKSGQKAERRRAEAAQQLRGRLVTSGIESPPDDLGQAVPSPLEPAGAPVPAPEVQTQSAPGHPPGGTLAAAPVAQQPVDTAPRQAQPQTEPRQRSTMPGRAAAAQPAVPRRGVEAPGPGRAPGSKATWVEIEETTRRACDELGAVQIVRSEASRIRVWARQVLDEADSIQDRSERVTSQSSQILAKAVYLNPTMLKPMSDTLRGLEEAIRTERHLRMGNRQQVEEEAEWARQRATEAVLSALSAVSKVSSYVSRELEEARRAAGAAEALKATAHTELQRAHAMMIEAESLVRREARKLLAQPLSGEETASPSDLEAETRGRPSAEHPPLGLGAEAPYEIGARSSSNLHDALERFRWSIGEPESGAGVDPTRSEALFADLQPARPEPETAPVGDAADLAVIDELTAALQGFQGLSGAGDATPEQEQPPVARTPVFADPQPDVPQEEELADETAAELQAALNEFMASSGADQGTGAETPPAITVRPPVADQGIGMDPFVAPFEQDQGTGMETLGVPPVQASTEGGVPVVEPQEPGLSSDRDPMAPSAAELQDALNEFLQSGDWSDAGADQEPVTSEGEGSGGVVPGHGDVAGELQSALDSFLDSVGDPERKPDQAPPGDMPPDQPADPGTAGLETALEEFLGSFGTSEPPQPQGGDAPAPTVGDGLQAALDDFLGSMEDEDRDAEPESDAPRNLGGLGLGGTPSIEPPVNPAGGGGVMVPPSAAAGLLLGNIDFAVEQSASAVVREERYVEYREYTRPEERGEAATGIPDAGPLMGGEVGTDDINTAAFADMEELTSQAPEPQAVEPRAEVGTLVGIVEPEEVEDGGNGSYSGVFDVIFTPAAEDVEMLCSFWDVLETAVGIGKVISEGELKDGSGHRFTVDLGEDILELDQLRGQDSSLEVKVLGADRLMIRTQSMAL
jgi:hypothetical protein